MPPPVARPNSVVWLFSSQAGEQTAPAIPTGLRVGDPAVVWFDPLHPGDEDAIPVALGTLEEIGDGPPTGVRLL